MRALSVLLLTTALAFGEITLDPRDRVPNVGTGYCSWCSLEMIGRRHNIKALFGLVERRRQIRKWDEAKQQWIEYGGAEVTELSKELEKLKIHHYVQPAGTKKTVILEYANTVGVVVSLQDYPAAGDHHSILLTSWNETDDVTFIDCNELWLKTSGEVIPQTRQASSKWFNKHWTGAALTLKIDAKKEEFDVRQYTPGVDTRYEFEYQSAPAPRKR